MGYVSQLMRCGMAALVVSTGASAALAQDVVKVVVSQRGGWDASVVELGDRAGIFESEGLKLELIFASGGGEPIQAVASGSADVSVSTSFSATLGAIEKGAPLRIVSSAFTGSSDSFWYVPAASTITSFEDAGGKTAAFTGYGSSSQLVLNTLLEQFGVTDVETVAGGNVTAIRTAVMSGQIDIGFSLAPINLVAVNSGEIRVIARGGEAHALQNLTTRVNIVSNQALAEKPEVIRRFMSALNKSLDFMYNDDRALEWFGAIHSLDVEQTRQSRDTYHPRNAMQTGEPQNVELLIKIAKENEVLPESYTVEDALSHVTVITGGQ